MRPDVLRNFLRNFLRDVLCEFLREFPRGGAGATIADVARRADRDGRGGPSGTTAIEFLPPDEHAFGGADGTTFHGLDDEPDWGADPDDDTPRSRWATLVAALTVVGLLTAGVVAAAPWAGDDSATAPTTVPTTLPVAPPTTSDRGTDGRDTVTTAPAPIDPTVRGWLLDPPVAGQRLVALADPGQFVDPLPLGWGEVWASPDATRTTGRWISITVLEDRGREPFDPVDAAAIPVDDAGRPARAVFARDGVLQLQLLRDGDAAPRFVTIDAFGFTVPGLLELAAGLTLDTGRPGADDDRPVVGRPELLDGLERIAAEPTSIDLVDAVFFGSRPGASAWYEGPDPRDVTLLVDRPAGSVDRRLEALAFTSGLRDGAATWALFDGFRPDDYAVGERAVEQFDLRVVRFTTGGDEVVLVTTLAGGALPALLDDVRRVTAEEWAEARDRSMETPGFTELPRDDARTTIGSGTLADGSDWSVDVFAPSGDVTAEVRGFVLAPRPLTSVIGTDREGAIGSIVLDGAAVVVGASSVEGAQLRIRSSDGSVTQRSLTAVTAPDEPPTEPGRLDESFWTSWEGASMVAVAVEPTVAGTPFAAEIVGPDGTVLTSFDPWLLGGDV